jgi:hypothetical protein
MLGGHERDCARPRSRAACPGSRVLVATRSLTSFQATAREQLSQQSRAGESVEPGPVICAAKLVHADRHGVHTRTACPAAGPGSGGRRSPAMAGEQVYVVGRGKLSRSGRPAPGQIRRPGSRCSSGASCWPPACPTTSSPN